MKNRKQSLKNKITTLVLDKMTDSYFPFSMRSYFPDEVCLLSSIPINRVVKNLTVSKKSIPKILFLSNMMKEKGVYVLLEACKIILNKVIIYQTDFIGAFSDITEADFDDLVLKNNL